MVDLNPVRSQTTSLVKGTIVLRMTRRLPLRHLDPIRRFESRGMAASIQMNCMGMPMATDTGRFF